MKPSVLLSRLAVLFVAGISTVVLADPAARTRSSACRRRSSTRPRTTRSSRIKRFSLPKGLQASLWAAEPMLANPVAIDFDEKGRLFVSETYRYRTSVLDIRDYMGMLELDLAARTIEDRAALHRKVFGEQAKDFAIESEVVRLVEDTNGDGVADKSSVYRRRLQQRARRHRLGRARAPRQGVVHQHPEPVAAGGASRRQA